MSALSALFSLDPIMLMQGAVLFGASTLLFFLLYTLRDITLRTHSFGYQCACVLLAGALPIVGFLVYLLIRPARTIKEREMEAMLRRILGEDEVDDLVETPLPETDEVITMESTDVRQ